jgi:hypothetical protein
MSLENPPFFFSFLIDEIINSTLSSLRHPREEKSGSPVFSKDPGDSQH